MLALMQSDSKITLEDIADRWQRDAGFTPKMDAAVRDDLCRRMEPCDATDPYRMLTPLFDRIETWHSARFVPWLGPLPMTQTLVLATLVLALVAVFANVKVRYDQGQIWKANPEITKIADAMSFSTADAPYFLGHAAAAERGLSADAYDRKRVYPNNATYYEERPDTATPAKRPLLSTLISALSPSDSPSDLLNAGHTILIVSAGATAVMIILAFGAAGYWLEGAVAAMGGGLSSAYLVRSSFGRIDTDQLNLGLMYLMFGLVMLSARSKTTVATLIWAVAAGATAKIFMVWYGKPELIWMAIAAFLWLVVVLRKDLKIAALSLLLFYALAPVSLPNPFTSTYVQNNFVDGVFLFPNTLKTVTEITRISLPDILVSATRSVEMGLVCLFGLGVWAIRHPVMAFAFGPLAAFALLNFVLGNRAVFYSVPIMWFGAAFLLTSTARFVAQAVLPTPENTAVPKGITQTASLAGVTLALITAWVNSPTDYLPRPSFPKPVLEGMIKLKNNTTANPAVVASWWDYGYASLFLNDLPTLHDGGSQTEPVTHFLARALLTSNQKELVGTLQFLASKGNAGIEQYTTKAALYGAFNKPSADPVPDVYLVLTNQMTGWIPSISKLGNWDIETGKALIPRNNNGVEYVDYIRLGCTYRGFPARMACGDFNFDFDRGDE